MQLLGTQNDTEYKIYKEIGDNFSVQAYHSEMIQGWKNMVSLFICTNQQENVRNSNSAFPTIHWMYTACMYAIVNHWKCHLYMIYKYSLLLKQNMWSGMLSGIQTEQHGGFPEMLNECLKLLMV